MSGNLAHFAKRGWFLAVFVLTLLWTAGSADRALAQLGTGPIPPASYFNSMAAYEAGDFSTALRGFQNEWQGAVKNGANRWIDSICFHTMVGECYYQMGSLPEALDEFNAALNLFSVHADWMMSIQFPPTLRAANAGKMANCPWGRSGRPAAYGDYPESFGMQQGRINNNAVIQKGGVVQQAMIVPVNYREILRCTTLALRRRRELMGVVTRFDPLSNQILGAFTGATGRVIAPPGHWSSVWANVQAGLAYAAAGNDAQAYKLLDAATYAGGEFVHPLSGTAMFEMGRIELSNARFEPALMLFAEASYAAFQYGDAGVLEECFRYGQMAHLLANKPGIYPPLVAAHKWARNKPGYRYLFGSLSVLIAENAAVRNEPRVAAAALLDARNAIVRRDPAQGKLGARFNMVSALLSYQGGKIVPGDEALALALGYQKKGSLWLWHIRMADVLYQKGSLTAREAMEIYGVVLREPTAADWLSDPLESLSAISTPHSAALERWFEVAVERKENEAALEIADLTRRHRFFSTLALGGRLLALRWVLEGPEELLTKEDILDRQGILGQYPKFAELSKQAQRMRAEIEAMPLSPDDQETQRKQSDAMKALADVYVYQELILREIAVRRQPCAMTFPPKRRVEDMQKLIPEKQAMLAFFVTPRRVYGFLMNRDNYGIWDVGSPVTLFEKVSTLMQQLGHLEGNRVLPLAQLSDHKWRKTSHELFELLIKGAKTDFPGDFEELIVVPDGALWYVPFELLTHNGDPKSNDVLISKVRIRYAPTAGLSVPDLRGRKQSPTTVVALGKMFPRDEDKISHDAFDQFAQAIPGSTPLSKKLLPAPANLYSSFFDRLVVYDDIIPPEASPFDFSPLPSSAGTFGSTVDTWMSLPWIGPELMILPAYHTAAESSLKKIKAEVAGADVFLSVMGLMGSGARTVLISRWRTGGQNSYDLIREFAKELPHGTAASAWQRSVLLAMDCPLKPDLEPRLQMPAGASPPNASHPFFWAGYMLVDSGDPPKKVDNGPAPDPLLDPKLEEKKRLLEEKKKQEELKGNGEAKKGEAEKPAGKAEPEKMPEKPADNPNKTDPPKPAPKKGL